MFVFTENSNVTGEIDINRISTRVMDELVRPFNEIHLDENEFVAIKAIVFFDPSKCLICVPTYSLTCLLNVGFPV